jgi:hypothetical protein
MLHCTSYGSLFPGADLSLSASLHSLGAMLALRLVHVDSKGRISTKPTERRTHDAIGLRGIIPRYRRPTRSYSHNRRKVRFKECPEELQLQGLTGSVALRFNPTGSTRTRLGTRTGSIRTRLNQDKVRSARALFK